VGFPKPFPLAPEIGKVYKGGTRRYFIIFQISGTLEDWGDHSIQIEDQKYAKLTHFMLIYMYFSSPPWTLSLCM
jgi:hypothetical protein